MNSRLRFGAAEGDVGDDFGDQDLADQRAVRIVAMHAVAGARPDAAGPVDAEAVEQAGGPFGEDLAAPQVVPSAPTVKRRIWRGPSATCVAPVSAT